MVCLLSELFKERQSLRLKRVCRQSIVFFYFFLLALHSFCSLSLSLQVWVVFFSCKAAINCNACRAGNAFQTRIDYDRVKRTSKAVSCIRTSSDLIYIQQCSHLYCIVQAVCVCVWFAQWPSPWPNRKSIRSRFCSPPATVRACFQYTAYCYCFFLFPVNSLYASGMMHINSTEAEHTQ